jgi:3-oxoacyl-[acyl-carrier protein] reductase
MSDRTLQGKVALVTGASRGIGSAVAVALARSGARVIVNFKDESEAANAERVIADIKALGQVGHAVRADLRRIEEIEALFDATGTLGGAIDIVVSNAAGDAVIRPIAETTEEDYDRVMTLNARSQFFVLRAAARRVRPGGRIIVIATTSVVMPYPGTASYGGAKRAAELYALVLASELGAGGTTVNVVAPGPTDTETFRRQNPPERIRYVESVTPLGRLGRPDDIADVVLFLASHDARWITRQVIQVGGGVV